MSILSILFWIAVVFWTIWFIGYPVYKKIKGQEILTLYYVLVLDICAVIVSVLNILKLLIFYN